MYSKGISRRLKEVICPPARRNMIICERACLFAVRVFVSAYPCDWSYSRGGWPMCGLIDLANVLTNAGMIVSVIKVQYVFEMQLPACLPVSLCVSITFGLCYVLKAGFDFVSFHLKYLEMKP